MQNNTQRPFAAGLVVLTALARLVQRVNFAPVGALSLFAGGRMRGWKAYALPLVLMAVTDPFLGGYSFDTPFVYASFLIYVWIGSRLRQTENPLVIGSAAVLGSAQFFILTNFSTWLGGTIGYPYTLSGLLQCYIAAIPFYGRTLASDLIYTAVLFGAHSFLTRTVARSERVAVEAI